MLTPDAQLKKHMVAHFPFHFEISISSLQDKPSETLYLFMDLSVKLLLNQQSVREGRCQGFNAHRRIQWAEWLSVWIMKKGGIIRAFIIKEAQLCYSSTQELRWESLS